MMRTLPFGSWHFLLVAISCWGRGFPLSAFRCAPFPGFALPEWAEGGTVTAPAGASSTHPVACLSHTPAFMSRASCVAFHRFAVVLSPLSPAAATAPGAPSAGGPPASHSNGREGAFGVHAPRAGTCVWPGRGQKAASYCWPVVVVVVVGCAWALPPTACACSACPCCCGCC